jgi:two-component system, OmpR family, sensor histidine kinase MtrB
MRERSFRLRTVLQSITIAVMLLALALTVSVFVMTQYLNRVSAALAAAVENVRATEETQIALLRHARSSEPRVALEFEEEMLRNLADVRRGATSALMESVDQAEAQVRTYLESARAAQPPADLQTHFASAFRVLDEISDLNIAQARQARDTAARWDRVLSLLGTLVGASVLVLTGWLLWWMRTQAFQPVFALARAMEEFARGNHEARAEERGPTELREMVEQFNHMATALAAQRQARIAFLAGVAHDLRNPLSALSLSVGRIEPGGPLPPEPHLRRTIELVQRQLKKLERMVSDFMDMAQIDAGQLDLHLEQHDLRALVQEVVSLFAATAPEHRIELRLPPASLLVRCDALRVEQIIGNLLSNAIKYSPSAHEIDVALSREGEYASIAVRDYGMGISEEDQRVLFEPFQRASLAKQTTIPGTGLGLYVVNRLVAAHGGSIEVSSSPGNGARFSVKLPLDAAAQAAASGA